MAGMKCKKIIEYVKEFVISSFGVLGLDVKEIKNSVITTFFCVVVSFLIVLIGIGAGPVLFSIVGYSIDGSKEITSLEAASLTIQALVAVVVIQLTLALKKLKKSKKIKNNGLLVR